MRAADPLNALLLFHRSVRAALETFDAVAEQAELDAVDERKATALHDFFVGPMRWHDEDERESLLKRLARLDPARFAKTAADAQEERAAIDEASRAIVGHLLAVAEARAPANAVRLRGAAATLRAILEPHLLREERDVFPAARALLSHADLDEMAREMAERRRARTVQTAA